MPSLKDMLSHCMLHQLTIMASQPTPMFNQDMLELNLDMLELNLATLSQSMISQDSLNPTLKLHTQP
jgi:hypothetical protein